MKRALLLFFLVSTGCSGISRTLAPVTNRLATGDPPDIIAQIHCQSGGFLGGWDLSFHQWVEGLDVAARLNQELAGQALVGATVAIWTSDDDLVTRLNVRSRDHFQPAVFDSQCNRVTATTRPAPPLQERLFDELGVPGGEVLDSLFQPLICAAMRQLTNQICEED